jgi:glycerol uptake facilitator-like aquaporin
MFRKNKLAMLVSEFLGTGVLMLTILSITNSQLSLAYFIAIAAGLAVLLLTLSLAGISGAIFNPAITLALWTVRKIKTLQALTYIAVQFLGAAVAWWLFAYFTNLSDVPNNGKFESRILVAEALGTFVFAFVWAGAVYQRFGLYAKAAAIGGGLTLGAFVASLGSSGYLNPAVALGAHSWGWATYVLGPVIGAIIGFNLYNLLFVQTEVAEIAESKAEKSKTTKLNASLTTSLVAEDLEGRNRTASAKAKTAVVKKSVAAAKKAPAKKAPAKKSTTTARRKNPNAA